MDNRNTILSGIVVVIVVALFLLDKVFPWVNKLEILFFGDYQTTLYSQEIQLTAGQAQDITFDINVDEEDTYRFLIQLSYAESSTDFHSAKSRKQLQIFLVKFSIKNANRETLSQESIESLDLVYADSLDYSYKVTSVSLPPGTYSVFLTLNQRREFSDNVKGIFIRADRRPKA